MRELEQLYNEPNMVNVIQSVQLKTFLIMYVTQLILYFNLIFFSLYNWMVNYFNFIVNDMGSHRVHTYIVPCVCLRWPDDGCFTAETCSPDVIDISSLC